MADVNLIIDPRAQDGYLGYALTQAAHCWRTGLAKELRSLGITVPQFFAIASLYRVNVKKGERPSQRQLAERIAMDMNTASQVIRTLEKRGIIIRTPHPTDTRAVALGLSAEGMVLAATSTQQARDFNERFFVDSSQAFLQAELTKLISCLPHHA